MVMASPQKPEFSIEPEGDRCLMVRYAPVLDTRVSTLCLAAARAIERAGLPGVLDVVPSFTTVAVHYQPSAFPHEPCQTLGAAVAALLDSSSSAPAFTPRTVRVPVCYEDEFAMDMEYVSDICGLTKQQAVALHSSDHVSVFALGFAPGAPYIGVHNEKFDLPRRPTPRTEVPGGSVAIANRQSVIYPNTSPGGWHVIGAMPVPLFDPGKSPHTFLQPGDVVRLTPITRSEFQALRQDRT
jgi:KipI family sensor histidine kinase inhibitor